MRKPLVSICCLVYNHEKYIRECLEGFVIQNTDFNIEFLIHDDASTDGTANIIREYEKKYPELIKPIYQTENQYSKGVRPTFAFNIPRAQGKYIAMCEGDDYWTDPLKLQKQVDFLEANPDYIMCFTNVNDVDEKSNIIKKKKLYYKKDIFEHIDMPFLAPTLTRVMRNEYLNELKWPSVKGIDNFLLTYHSKFGKTKFMDIVTAHYRRHNGGVFSSLTEEEKILHKMETRLFCLSIAEYPLKLKLFQKVLNYCFILRNESNYSRFRTALLKTYSFTKKEKLNLKRKDSFRIKKSLFLLKITYSIKSYRINNLIKKSILLIYQPSDK